MKYFLALFINIFEVKEVYKIKVGKHNQSRVIDTGIGMAKKCKSAY
ncbi:MAG: hypothetical protein ACWGHH_06760 [Sulfurovaceae bacterium]